MDKMVTVILACDNKLGIGKDGGIPWHYTEDMNFFVKNTKEATCIMGRKTYDDIYKKLGDRDELLNGRESIVITRNPSFEASGARVAHSLTEAFKLSTRENVFVIGGLSLYEEAIGSADSVLITDIPDIHECDVVLSSEFIRTLLMKFKIEYENRSESGLTYTKYVRK